MSLQIDWEYRHNKMTTVQLMSLANRLNLDTQILEAKLKIESLERVRNTVKDIHANNFYQPSWMVLETYDRYTAKLEKAKQHLSILRESLKYD